MAKYPNEKGLTLIEVIFAIFLLTVGIFGVSNLITYLVFSSTISSQRLIASYLAQEGIEIVRNIRDTNLLEGENWDNGLAPGNWQADYNDQNLSPYNGALLRIDGGFYNYDSGNLTSFQRKISISKPQADVLEIRVQVFWQERGRSHQLIAQENLYNWR